jgi:RNA polymerase sigma-70 factor (ECF subfamily)
MEDSFLIQQVLAGNASVFKFLVLRYQRPIFRFLRGFGLEEQVIEELARSRRGREVPETVVETEATFDERPGQQELAEARESREALGAAMQRLPSPFRSAVLLSCLQELSIEEVARIENCTPGTVKSRVFRGKQLLRGLLAGFSEA